MPDGYSNHQPSVRQWLRDAPEHWATRRIRTVAEMRVSNVDKHTSGGEIPVRLCNYVDVYKNDRITQQIPFMRATASEEEIDKFKLNRNDVVITKDSETWDDIGVPALVTEPADDLISGYHLAILRPKPDTYGPYLFWTLQSKPIAYQFHVEAKGVTRYGLGHHGIQSALIPHPPLPEQEAIVRYLDAADQQIQAYIGAKQKLIALLEEERQAAIHQAVTRGLDPNARLKPSSVEWLGYVPEHWQTRRLRTVADMRVSNVDKHTNEDESPVRLCNYVDVYKNERITEDIPFMHASASPDEIERFRLICNDVIITKDSETWDDIGVPALVEYSATDLVCGYHLAILRPTEIVHGPFLARALQSETVCRQFHVGAKGVTRYGLAQNAIQDALIPLPPLREQKVIAKQLDQDTKAIDATKKAAHQQIELMQEYRTRLIADAVTGKIDVRKVAEELPQLGPAEIID